jgi:hypothetical protein
MRTLLGTLLAVSCAFAWGVRGHHEMNRAVVEALADTELQFLLAQKDWIVYLGPIPDSYRTNAEPFLKIFEDPNHGWFLEQSRDLMSKPPRSRYEFVVELHEQYQQSKDKLTNVRWTGTMPYAAIEHYERIKAAFRRIRQARTRKEDTRFVEQEAATYIGLLGHYMADGSQPLHITIHHDGWQGDNPNGYATDRIHGRMETQFVDLIELKSSDLTPRIGKPVVYDDPFQEIVNHYLKAGSLTETVYRIDKQGGWADKENKEARELVTKQLAGGAEVMRNLIYTAWVKSAPAPASAPAPGSGQPAGANDGRNMTNPISPANPLYNPKTGSAPAAK